jgi:hypothetical protein
MMFGSCRKGTWTLAIAIVLLSGCLADEQVGKT